MDQVKKYIDTTLTRTNQFTNSRFLRRLLKLQANQLGPKMGNVERLLALVASRVRVAV
jgi:hypothetical protein